MKIDSLEASFSYCTRVALQHYENFPVGSWMIPKEKRKYVHAIYAFARRADDFADENPSPPKQVRGRPLPSPLRGEGWVRGGFSDEKTYREEKRLNLLEDWEKRLEECVGGEPADPIFIALKETIKRHDIPVGLLKDLIAAFKMDIVNKRYQKVSDLLTYCRYSANPVGRIVLHLFGHKDPELHRLSDFICTALQLTNFWQDITIDLEKDRVYLPVEDMEQFGYTVHELRAHVVNDVFRDLLAKEVEFTRGLFREGMQLCSMVDRRLSLELRAVWSGGMMILKKIEENGYDVFNNRPMITMFDKVKIISKVLVMNGKCGQRPFLSLYLKWNCLIKMVAVHIFHIKMSYKTDLTAESHRLTKESNSNFYYSFFSLSTEKRRAVYAVYALCRSLDDVVDRTSSRLEASEALLKWTTEIINMFQGKPSHPITVNLKPYAERYSIPQKYFFELIKGVEMDLTKNRYDTFDELHKYCYRVASIVGLICAEVFGYRNATTLGYAVDLGIAMQLTNILRDVKDDALNGRIYLPREDLKKFGYTEEELLSSKYNQAFVEMMRFECERARNYYKRAGETLPKEDRRSMVAAEIMRAIYSHLLQKIESVGYDVFSHPAKLSKFQKIFITIKSWGKNRFGG